MPPKADHYLHSHGGEDGLDVIRRILAGLPQHLTPEGRFEIVTWSPGSESEVALVPLMREALPGHRLMVHHLDKGAMRDHCQRFAKDPGFEAWQQDLEARGLTHVHFVFVASQPDDEPRVVDVHPDDEIARCHAIADAWHAVQAAR